MRNIQKEHTIELMKCGKILYVDMPFSLVVLLLSTTEHHCILLTYLLSFFFFQIVFMYRPFCWFGFILRCSLKPVFGFLPIYVMEFGVIYSWRVNFIYSAFSWPMTELSGKPGPRAQWLGTTLLFHIKRITSKYISILKAFGLVIQTCEELSLHCHPSFWWPIFLLSIPKHKGQKGPIFLG